MKKFFPGITLIVLGTFMILFTSLMLKQGTAVHNVIAITSFLLIIIGTVLNHRQLKK